MIVRNKPIPIAIARFRSIGIAFSTAFAEARQHEEGDDEALDDDHAHRLRVGEAAARRRA